MNSNVNTKTLKITRTIKQRIISMIVACVVATAIIPAKVAPIANLSPISEAQAQMGQGGPMNMVMLIVLMLIMGKMMNGQQGQPMLVGLQRDRAADSISNIDRAINGPGIGIAGAPAPGMPGYYNPNQGYYNPNTGSYNPNYTYPPVAPAPQRPGIAVPLSGGMAIVAPLQ
jgi:hypothetical protein